MATEINKTDSLNQGRKKINDAINQSNDAITKSEEALSNSESTQDQLDTLIIESGTSDAETLQARTGADGTTYDTVKERLDAEYSQQVSVKNTDVTVNIPTDYSTLQDAVDDLKDKTKKGATITLLIESGHALTQGLKIKGEDCSHFEISSVDPTVYLDPNFVGVNVTQDEIDKYPVGTANVQSGTLFLFMLCKAPRLNCLIDMENQFGSGLVSWQSEGAVSIGSGVINAGVRGANFQTSHWSIKESNFSGANDENIRMQHGSVVTGMKGIYNNGCKTNGWANIYISKGCLANFRESDATGSGASGLRARRSKVDVEGTDFSNASDRGIWAELNSQISASQAIANNCTVGVQSQQGSTVSGPDQAMNSVGYDLRVQHGGEISGTAETTNSISSGLNPSPIDCNVPINRLTGEGMITSENHDPIFDSGGDSINGFWIRYNDGTQICCVRDFDGNGLTGGSERTATWTYPKEFTENPTITLETFCDGFSGDADEFSLDQRIVKQPSLSSVDIKKRNSATGDINNAGTSIHAVGRWK